MRLLRASLIVAAMVTAEPVAAQTSRARDTVLARLARYVSTFQSDFTHLVGTERYTQVLRDVNSLFRTRQLVSDIFFVGADDEGRAMTVRSVLSVDGRDVPGAAISVQEALRLPGARRLDMLSALANASARYNLGSLRRNFNDPTLALMFGSAPFQKRFRFRLGGLDRVDGVALQRVSVTERARPTVIHDARNGANIPASGVLWLDDDGVVWRSELHLDTSDTVATITATFQRDPRLGVVVPVSMDEEYRYRDRDTRQVMQISAHATYEGYRRFETSVRIVPQ